MTTVKHWETIPADDFADRESWRALGKNRFAALRIRVLIIQTSGEGPTRPGPVLEEQNIPANATFTLRLTRKKVVSRTESFSAAIGVASTRRITDKLAVKLSSQISAELPGFKGAAAAETVAESTVEISEEIERTLTTSTSHSVEDSEEREHGIALPAEALARTAQIRLLYFPHRWDIYLHSFEYLELSYRKKWLWKQVRETIKQASSGPLGRPLKSLSFYQPQPTEIFTVGAVVNALDEPDAVEVAVLATPMPTSAPPSLTDLETLAKFAFPVTKPEKKRAATRAGSGSGQGVLGLASGPSRFKAKRKMAKKKAAPRRKASAKAGAASKAKAKVSARKIGRTVRAKAKPGRAKSKRAKTMRRR